MKTIGHCPSSDTLRSLAAGFSPDFLFVAPLRTGALDLRHLCLGALNVLRMREEGRSLLSPSRAVGSLGRGDERAFRNRTGDLS